MEKYFVSFASSDFQPSVSRLYKQALSLNYFADATVMTESDLDQNFWQQFQSRLVKGSRGYGYWCWKPQVVLQTLAKMNDGDVLLYCDVGCHLTGRGEKTLDALFAQAASNESGLVTFGLGVSTDAGPVAIHQEQHWTKGDVFQRLNLLDDVAVQKRAQTMATVFLVRKCDRTVAMIRQMIALISEDFDLITDAKSTTPNFEGFIEHRHDQSLFSLLFYLNYADVLSSAIVTTSSRTKNPGWLHPESQPIQVKRDRKRKFWVRKRDQVNHALLKIGRLLRS